MLEREGKRREEESAGERKVASKEKGEEEGEEGE